LWRCPPEPAPSLSGGRRAADTKDRARRRGRQRYIFRAGHDFTTCGKMHSRCLQMSHELIFCELIGRTACLFPSLWGYFLPPRDTTPCVFYTGTGETVGISFSILTKLCAAIVNRNIQSTRVSPRSLICFTGRCCFPQPNTFSTSFRLS